MLRTPSRYQQYNPQTQNKYDTKCVCQICTCGKHQDILGKHHCPQKRGTRFDAETTHQHDYKPYRIAKDPPISIKHQYHEKHYDPDLIKSNYDINYTPHKIIPNQNNRVKYEYHPRNVHFDDRTEYNDNYIRNQIPRDYSPNKNKKIYYNPDRAKFQGTTTYNAQFTPKKAQTKEIYTPQPYQKRKQPFQGNTTYNLQYVPHQIEPNRPQKGINTSYNPRRTRFQGQSSYKEDYHPHQIQYHQRCPIERLPQRPRQCSPGKTHLNYSAQKKCWA